MNAEPEFEPIGFDDSIALCRHLAQRDDLSLRFLPEDRMIVGMNEDHEKAFEFRFPLRFPDTNESRFLTSYLEKLDGDSGNALILLVQAGHAALGYAEGRTIVHHKVISKYMVRAKQGKAQLTHLKTKGKSRAGSRIRLAQSEQFCHEIHDKIRSWNVIENATHILYSCTPRLWSTLFEAKYQPIFERQDDRVLHVTRDVDRPGFDELKRINNYGFYGRFGVYRDFNFKGIEDFLP